MSNPLLSVVVPAFNEATRLADSLEKIVDYLQDRQLDFELVVVDDGSSDETASVASRFKETQSAALRLTVLCNSRNRGKGFSVRKGVLASRGRFTLFSDADLSTPIRELAKLENAAIDGEADIAFGSRDVMGSQVEIHQSWFRENGGKLFNRWVRLVTGLPFWDTQCGFKLFRMDSCRPLFELQRLDRFAFDVELLYLGQKRGLKMVEIPVVWRHAEGSAVRFLPDAPRAFAELLRIRWNDIRRRYGPESS